MKWFDVKFLLLSLMLLTLVVGVTACHDSGGSNAAPPATEGEGEGEGEVPAPASGAVEEAHDDAGLLSAFRTALASYGLPKDGAPAGSPGVNTCVTCHASTDATEVHGSVHYQWAGPTDEVASIEGDSGKMTGINSFCTYPAVNFIGLLTNADGDKVSGGCAQCHVGLGIKPSAEATDEQLENIDCLICHSKTYKRKVVLLDATTMKFGFMPDEAAMGNTIGDVMLDDQPFETCVSCHGKAGGGPNNKRGDLEPEHANAEYAFDAHMASTDKGGAGLVCIDCHTTTDHKILGRGADLRPNDVNPTADSLACIDCHKANDDDTTPQYEVHESARLNLHTTRVNCTVCHIPSFARGAAGTDMDRDFSALEYHATKKLYEPVITRGGVGTDSSVVPEYAWWNGTSFVSKFGDAVVDADSDGFVDMAVPNGDITDGQINAFKVHTGNHPKRTDAEDSLIGLKMGVLFQLGLKDPDTGQLTLWNTEADQAAIIKTAINAGVSAANAIDPEYPLLPSPDAYEFVQTERWMGIFHEVAPASEALSCGDCHGDTADRLDFAALGYSLKSAPEVLCAACHGSSIPSYDFYSIHAKKVDELGWDCSQCHNFNDANTVD